VCDDLLEVLRGSFVGLLEALTNPLVRVPDQALELGEGALEVLALALELLDVGDRLVVLLRCERVDRAELLAAAGEAVDTGGELGAAIVVERLLGGLRGQAKALGDLRELAGRVR
jgi:hypothetical protein